MFFKLQFALFLPFSYQIESKKLKTWKKHISTSEHCAQHLFAGRNMQQVRVKRGILACNTKKALKWVSNKFLSVSLLCGPLTGWFSPILRNWIHSVVAFEEWRWSEKWTWYAVHVWKFSSPFYPQRLSRCPACLSIMDLAQHFNHIHTFTLFLHTLKAHFLQAL